MTNDAVKKTGTFNVKRTALYLVLALMMAASVWVWRYSENGETAKARARFDEYCQEIVEDIIKRFSAYKMILQGGAGLFIASEEVTREEWRAYVEYHQVHTLYPGTQAMGFAKVVPPGELTHLVESVRAEGFPEYTVRPEGERPLYTPVVFLEPLDAIHRPVLGYDMFSEPVRRAAMERARDTASPAMTGRLRLVIEDAYEEVQDGYILCVPVFDPAVPPDDVEARRPALIGFVYSVLRLKDLMRGIFPKAPQMVAFALYDGTTVAPEALLFASSELDGGSGTDHRARFSSHTTLELYGHPWTLAFRSTPQFDAGAAPLYQPWTILAAGLFTSILIFLLMRTQQKITVKAEALAESMTSALRESEEDIRASEREKTLILENANESIAYHDRDHRLVWANGAYLAGAHTVTGLPATVEDVKGKKCFDALGLGKICHHCPVSEAIRTGTPQEAVLTPHNQPHWPATQGCWLVRAAPVRDSTGAIIGAIEMAHNITERVRTEEKLRASEEHLRTTLYSIGDAVISTDAEGCVVSMNPMAESLTGWSEQEATGQPLDTVFRIVNEQTGRPVESPVRKVLKQGVIVGLANDTLLLARDGRQIPIADSGAPIRNEAGEATGVVLVFRDQTEGRKALQALRESEERFRMMAENVKDYAIFMLDPGGHVMSWSAGAEKITGYRADEIVGQHFSRFYTKVDIASGKPEQVLKVAAAEGRFEEEGWQVRKDGSQFRANVVFTALRNEASQLLGFVKITRDVTEQKQAEADRIARQAAEQANQAKSLFLTNMSHEIRTPLNAILGFTQVLERDPSLTQRQTGMLHTVVRSGQHLLNLINDILDMSRIEAGRLELNPANFCLHDLLDDLEMMFRSHAQAKQLQLLMERDDSVPRYVNADEAKLRQVLVNLVGNAVKFTETGGVTVRVRGETAAGNAAGDTKAIRLVVEVEDSGPGIAEEELDRIFEPFKQSAEGAKAGGTGLGLAVSRCLVELMSGSLTVKSEVGKGSCFRFDAPVTPVEGSALEEERETRQVVGLEPGTGPYRILIVDDQEDNRDLLVALLEPLKFDIREVVNGQEALEVFEAWSPHAVLMDLRMPVLDGYEATRRIKATEQGRATPVIAVTASVFEDAKKEVRAAGADGYIRKPFRTEEIFAVLEKCLGLRYVYAEGAKQAPEKADVQPLTREDLAALPEALRQGMLQAIDEGDMAGLRALIDQVEEMDAGAARKLRNLADQYDYETLTQVLTNEGEEEPDE